MFKTLHINLFFFLLFFFTEKSVAQNFLNGSFEINTSAPCNYNLSNAAFTGSMSNTTAYGGGGELDILGPGAGCPYGSPECGNWFVGMAYPGAPDAFTMDLSAPLVAGNSYTMSFWDKGDSQYPPGMPIVIGVSTLQGAVGTTVYTGPVPSINVWSQRIFTFVAPNNGQYISVETAGPTRWTHVDDFSLGTIGNFIATSNVTGSPFCACSSFYVPFISSGIFNAGNVYSVLLSDATGSFATSTTIGTLVSSSNADSILCTIPCNAVAGSLYQVQVVSSNPVNTLPCGPVVGVTITVGGGTAVSVNSPTICSGQTATLTAVGGTTYTWSTGVTNVGADTANAAPLVTTTYTVTGVGATCLDTAVATVTVVATLPVTVTSPTICAGQTTNLTAGGATTYTWSAGATSTGVTTADATPVITSTYTVTGTTGTCTGTAISTVTVNPAPAITVNSPTICSGQIANLTAAGGTTYTWSAGTTVTGTTTADATPVATTTYTVTGTSAGCSDSAIATVTVNPLPVITVNSPTICAGQTSNLTAGGGTTYTWSAGTTVTGVATADATPAITTTYTVTGTTNGCSATAIATVTVAASLPITVNSPTICSGQTANLTATGGTTYTWTAGATSTGVATADASPLFTTTYTVTGSSGTCSGTAVATVTVNTTPVVTVNSPTICSGQIANLTAAGATFYTWTAGANTTGGGNATATPIITTTYTVTGTTNGCTNTAISTVTVNPTPVVTVNSPTICSGQTAFLTATGATGYSWTTGATSSGGANATAIPVLTTTYTVTGTTGACTNTAVATVTVNTTPVVTVDSAIICSGQTATLTATGATSYVWSAGATSTGVATATASPTTSASYTITGTTNGCTATATSLVTVQNCISPIANFSGNPLTICNNGCANFIDLSLNTPTSWSWIFQGGVPANANTQGPINVCYSAVGAYTVTLIVSNIQGTDTLVRTNYVNVVNPIPVTITGDLTINACEPANLTAIPPGQTYSWGPNVNMVCNTCEMATVSPLTTQQYYCEYTDINGCYDADTATVVVTEIFNYLMPTGFSPNGDNVNDVLYVKGKGVDFIELKIYDRVGEKVFETSDLYKGWDGTLYGVPMNTGVFVYTLEVTYCNGQTVKEHGSVMLEK